MPLISKENWLSGVDLGSYKFTLYLVEPGLWNAPQALANDDAPLRAGRAVIIAQSGVTGGYGIDNVVMQATVVGTNMSGNIPVGVTQFDLHEPLGFKLLNRILSYAKALKFKTMQNAHYVLKLEFDGREVTSGVYTKHSGVYFYPLVFSQITASIGPQGTTYNIIASNNINAAAQETITKTDLVLLEVRSVGDMISRLQDTLNGIYKENERANSSDSTPNTNEYIIKMDDTFSRMFKEAKWGGQSDPVKGDARNRNLDDPNKADIPISPETNIVTWLKEAILKNVPAFARWQDAFRKENADRIPIITILPEYELTDKIDKQTNELCKKITITIGIGWTYTVPQKPTVQEAFKSNSGEQRTRFQSLKISKKYEYLYSGNNTEVLDFSINFNNMFAVARYPVDATLYPNQSVESVPTNPDKTSKITTSPLASGNMVKASSSKFSPFIEDLQVQDMAMVETSPHAYVALSPDKQQVNERTGEVLTLEAIRIQEYHNRSTDSLECEVRIKGDPYWMGTPGAYVNGDVSMLDYVYTQDILMAFVTYNPDESSAIPGAKFKREFDYVSSGVYKILDVESKFMNGEFTQILKGVRDPNTTSLLVSDLLENL